MGQWVNPTYKAVGSPDQVVTSGAKVPAEKVIDWLLR